MISKSSKYGIRAAMYLGIHSSEENKISPQELSDALQLPKHSLGKILQEMVRRGIISSVKGPNGGFYLTDKNKMQKLGAIVECFDGEFSLSSCVLGFPECGPENPCYMHEHVVKVRKGMKTMFNKTTINQAVKEAWKNDFKI
ncbi:MAG: Rrf2 family transcriptional regulator [Bacteroidia bacterium]|nr:Rrf2 family transcriptional regulator [Bacteroidia bacterium]